MTTQPSPARLLIAAAAVLPALVACGSDTTANSAPEATTPTSACATSLTATFPDGSTVDLDTAEAVSLADGGAFTIYVGDYAIPTDGIATATIEPPAGSHQASIYLTPLGSLSNVTPIVEGTDVSYTTDPDVLTFSTVLFDDDDMYNQAVDASGTLTVDSISDSELCVTIDYTDADKQVEGTISAGINESQF